MRLAMDEEDRVRSARLKDGTLARFATPLSWRDILALGGDKRPGWWRHAVVDAENRGLLAWDRETSRWMLTDEGRERTRAVS
jgi:hypothetical protein